MNYQTKEEEQFKKYLQRDLLYRKGYKRYADELNDYYVNLTSSPQIEVAAVDSKNYIIFINRNHMYDNPDTLSMLIRHELLHAFLRHNEREIRELAYALGFDPDDLKKVEFEDILREMGKGNFAYRQYGNPGSGLPRSGNIAGDLDLSRYYLEKDIEISKELGGLLLEDHPEWLGLSFEEMREALLDEDRRLRRRVSKKAYGNFIDDNTFEVESEEDSEFNSNIIAIEDVKGITIPSIEEIKLISAQKPELSAVINGNFWVRDKYPDSFKEAYYVYNFSPVSFTTSDVNDASRGILPVLIIKNADLYSKAQNGEKMECLGLPWFLILEPHGNPYEAGKLIYADGFFGHGAFNDEYLGNDYKGSTLDTKLQVWLAKKKSEGR